MARPPQPLKARHPYSPRDPGPWCLYYLMAPQGSSLLGRAIASLIPWSMVGAGQDAAISSSIDDINFLL